MDSSTTKQGTRLLCSGFIVLAIGVGFALPAAAQSFHGAGILKQCLKSKAGDTTDCRIRIENVDEFGDTIRVQEAWDVIKPLTDQIRVPASGNLPITAILEPTTCTVGGTFPCDLGPGGRVVVRSNTYVIQSGDPDPLPDQANAIVVDLCDGTPSDDCPEGIENNLQFASVTALFQPSITVDKSGPDVAKAGDTITYEVLVTDTSSSDSPDLSCTANDSLAGDLGAVVPGTPTSYDFTIPAEASGSIDNTVTVTCSPNGFDNEIVESDTHVVDLIDPSIEVSKTGPASTKVGDTVTYTIGFANTGSGDLENCTGNDTVIGALGAFEAGVNRTFDHTVAAGDPDPLVNTATITCDVVGFDNTVSDEDSHSVDLIDPAITVSKTGPANAKVGDTVTYTIGFANTGEGDVENCTGNDTVIGALGAFEAGVDRTFDHTVAAGDPNPLVNVATITCDVVGFANTVSDDDSHSVDLIDPSIEVTKTGPDVAKAGDEIAYTIGFANTGDGNVENCTGNDTVLGALGAFEAGVDRTFNHTVAAGDPDPLDNVATITCDVVGFDNTVSDSDDHSVDLLAPDVSLSKECRPDPVTVGDDINWAITVENTGDTSLDCLVNDAEAGFVDEAVTVGAGLSESLNASRTVEEGDVPSISNTADVSCTLTGGALPNVLTDEASADCEVVSEEICRTPGFWGTHAGDDKRRSSNLTQTVIDAAGGSLEICGQTIDNTDIENVHSAVEAMCVRIEGFQQRQLARQLTAMALNCVVSGGGADCSGTSVEDLFAEANAACEANTENLSGFIEDVDAFNNGEECQERELDEATDIFDGIVPLPGPAGSSRACSSATGNGWKVVPAPGGETS